MPEEKVRLDIPPQLEAAAAGLLFTCLMQAAVPRPAGGRIIVNNSRSVAVAIHRILHESDEWDCEDSGMVVLTSAYAMGLGLHDLLRKLAAEFDIDEPSMSRVLNEWVVEKVKSAQDVRLEVIGRDGSGGGPPDAGIVV